MSVAFVLQMIAHLEADARPGSLAHAALLRMRYRHWLVEAL